MNNPTGAERPDQPGRAQAFGESARFAREVSRTSDELERMQRATGLAVTLVDGCDHAGITVLTERGPQTDAATSEVAWRGDQLQYELDEGPCLDAARQRLTVASNDIAHDVRWPRWGPAAAEELGVHSMMSFLLFNKGDSYGAFNMYGEAFDAFTGDDLAVAESLAAHLAVAIAASREIEHRGVAMISRTVIGQAEGILMERLGLDADQAFEYLRRVSSHTNRKLADLARDLVQTRVLPQSSADPPQ